MTVSSSISRVVVGVNRFTFLSYLVFSLLSLALLKSPRNNVAAIIEAAKRLRLGKRIFPRRQEEADRMINELRSMG
ncbi:hypothetical protein LINPERHAP1_LOCUS12587 [Linum perenne]